jgi:hypothetical protein
MRQTHGRNQSGEDGFVEVYDLIEAACRGLLVHIQENQLL